MTKLLKGFDDDLVTGMILMDLQKAFDTINHDTPLRKLSFKFQAYHAAYHKDQFLALYYS